MGKNQRWKETEVCKELHVRGKKQIGCKITWKRTICIFLKITFETQWIVKNHKWKLMIHVYKNLVTIDESMECVSKKTPQAREKKLMFKQNAKAN